MIGGSVTEFDKITPQTYIDMNKEFEEEGTMVRIEVPTQEAIDKWKKWKDPDMHKRTVEPRDMVQGMGEEIGIYIDGEREEYKNKTHIDRQK